MWLVTALFFVAVYLVYTHEITGHYGERIIGSLNDKNSSLVFYNNIYVFDKKVEDGHNPFFGDSDVYPKGVNMALGSHNYIMGAFCLPFKNKMRGMNIGLLISFVLSGLGATLLCYRFVPNIWLSVLVGFIFAFSPWKMVKLQEQQWFGLTATIPFFIYYYLDIFKFKENKYYPTVVSYKKLLYCIILWVITFFSETYLAFFLLYFAFYYVLFMQYIQPWTFPFKKPKFWIVAATVLTAISLLVGGLRKLGLDDKNAFHWGGDFLGYLFPLHKNWATDFFASMGVVFPPYQENNFFFGYALFALGIITWTLIKKLTTEEPNTIKSFFWLSLLLILISMPMFKVGGFFLFYLPPSIMHFVPFINNVSVISRIFILTSIIFPLAVVWYYHNTVEFKFKKFIPIIILAVLLYEFTPNNYKTIDRSETPAAVYALKDIKGEVVLPIPISVKGEFNKIGADNSNMLYYQTIFDKKIIGGYTKILKGEAKDLYMKDSVMRNIVTLSEDPEKQYNLPTKTETDEFFSKFTVDIIFIDKKYRGTSAEKYITAIANKRGYKKVHNKEYLILAKE